MAQKLLLRSLRVFLGARAPKPDPGDEPPARHGIALPEARPLQAQLDRIEAQLASLVERPPALVEASDRGQTDVQPQSPDTLLAVEKQLGRMAREQFKANALTEAQLEALNSTIESLRTADARRQAELESVRAEVSRAGAAARIDLVRALLPVLDGLDEALRTGHESLAQSPAAPTRPGRFAWLRHRGPGGFRDEGGTLRETMSSWLVGLSFVRERLLDVLASEGVQPIEAQGRPFDPALHVALDAVPATKDTPPGTVAAELRRGYVSGNQVLRHAEVAATRTEY